MTTAASETLDVPALQALGRATSLLEPHETHPAVADLVGKLKAATEEPEDETDESGDDWSTRVDKLAKALIGLENGAVELRKSDDGSAASIAAIAHNDSAKDALSREYAYLTGGAYRGERGEMLHAIQKRESGRGWKER